MNRVLAHTGARYPIVQAPMGWIARTALASAGSRDCGLGIIVLLNGIKAAQQIIDDTVAQFLSISARMGALAQAGNFG